MSSAGTWRSSPATTLRIAGGEHGRRSTSANDDCRREPGQLAIGKVVDGLTVDAERRLPGIADDADDSRMSGTWLFGPAPGWMRLPIARSPGKNRSANARFTISTAGARPSSRSVKSRPSSSGVPIV